MKKLYLATVCLFPPFYGALLIAVFLHRLPFPVGALGFLMAYFAIGFVVVLIDLWRSPATRENKAIWTILHILVGLISLPIYWFAVVRSRRSPPPLSE